MTRALDLTPAHRLALDYVRRHGDRTVEQFAKDHGADGLAVWSHLFNRGLVCVLHGTICITKRGDQAAMRGGL